MGNFIRETHWSPVRSVSANLHKNSGSQPKKRRHQSQSPASPLFRSTGTRIFLLPIKTLPVRALSVICDPEGGFVVQLIRVNPARVATFAFQIGDPGRSTRRRDSECTPRVHSARFRFASHCVRTALCRRGNTCETKGAIIAVILVTFRARIKRRDVTRGEARNETVRAQFFNGRKTRRRFPARCPPQLAAFSKLFIYLPRFFSPTFFSSRVSGIRERLSVPWRFPLNSGGSEGFFRISLI